MNETASSPAVDRATALDTVKRYLAVIADGTAEDIAALYAPKATLEDPAGSTPVLGRDAIAQFYAPIATLRRSTELLDFRATGGTVAFRFRIIVAVPGRTITTTPIDVLTVTDDGEISSMRAIWSEEDIEIEETA